jgi:hypothetical protein
LHTYRITISSLYNLVDLVNELTEKTNAEANAYVGASMHASSMKTRVDKIIDKLIEVKRAGGKPIIIIDEGENMEISLLKMFKALYDALKNHCAIVLIGTERLPNRMLNKNGSAKGRNREALPELYRRFKAGHKNIAAIDRSYRLILDKYVDDKGLRKLLSEICNNYGELHDYLEPALREADMAGVPLTENFSALNTTCLNIKAMATKSTHIQQRRQQAHDQKHEVIKLLNWSEQTYCDHQYNCGLAYLNHYIPADPWNGVPATQ